MELFKVYEFGERMKAYKFLGVTVLSFYITHHHFWFRLFGHGLFFKHKSEHLLYSQRNGHHKHICLFNWRIFWL